MTRCEGCPEPRLLREAQPGVAGYLLVRTQWHVGGMGQRIGLRYEAVLPMLERALPDWQEADPDMFGALTVSDLMADVQTIEAAMLAADDEREEAERARREAQRLARVPLEH